MRTVKEGEVRKKEILKTARNLFVTKGYEQTSITDILHVENIAKGTFYYYFSSKEEVLETIILDIVEEGARKAELVLQDKSLPIEQRILLAIMAQRPDFEKSEQIEKELHKVENAKLHQLYLKEMLRRMTQVLQEPLMEGIEQGLFSTDYPVECMEEILLLGHMMFDCNTFDWEQEEYLKKIKAFITSIERILGAKEGSLQNIMQLFR